MWRFIHKFLHEFLHKFRHNLSAGLSYASSAQGGLMQVAQLGSRTVGKSNNVWQAHKPDLMNAPSCLPAGTDTGAAI